MQIFRLLKNDLKTALYCQKCFQGVYEVQKPQHFPGAAPPDPCRRSLGALRQLAPRRTKAARFARKGQVKKNPGSMKIYISYSHVSNQGGMTRAIWAIWAIYRGFFAGRFAQSPKIIAQIAQIFGFPNYTPQSLVLVR